MLSPFMTVTVLVVLWLIVVVPMVLRRSDERRQDRSVAQWGRGMRALGRRAGAAADQPRTEVYVPRTHGTPLATPARRPVPAAQEALMYPPDRSDLSEARTRMLTRRRRSLVILIVGTIVFGLLGLVTGGLVWVATALFAAGLLGYTWFLRSQAMNDRSRRATRQRRAEARRPAGYDATADDDRFEDDDADAFGEARDSVRSVVRIDDDDFELQSMDTIDLTGLYKEEAAEEAITRRAS